MSTSIQELLDAIEQETEPIDKLSSASKEVLVTIPRSKETGLYPPPQATGEIVRPLARFAELQAGLLLEGGLTLPPQDSFTLPLADTTSVTGVALE